MKTMLVPVDFTPTCKNAVNFAAEWCKKYEYERIILLRTFYDSMFENLMVSAEYANLNRDNLNTTRQQATDQLRELCKELAHQAGPRVKVMTAVSEYPLLRGIFEILENDKPDLILLGSDNYNYSSGSIIAGNLISIARASTVRVLVVPATYHYKAIQQVLLPYNLNMLKQIDRLNSLKTNPLLANIKLLVLNIDPSQRAQKVNELSATDSKFDNLLKNFDHEIYYAGSNNLIDSIRQFTHDHDVQMILALPGKHSFLYNLTHASISEAIYRNARLPVLILK